MTRLCCLFRKEIMGDANAFHHGRVDELLHERVVAFIASGMDINLAADLRHHNSSEGGFDVFWEYLDRVIAKM